MSQMRNAFDQRLPDFLAGDVLGYRMGQAQHRHSPLTQINRAPAEGRMWPAAPPAYSRGNLAPPPRVVHVSGPCARRKCDPEGFHGFPA